MTAAPLRCLVVDDEAPGRANVRYALAAHPHWRLVAECEGAAQAAEHLLADPVDLAFLDVQMPGESGITLARRLLQLAEPPVLVFVTAYDRFAIQAFEVHALDYLLKPFDDERFAQALQRAEQLLRQRAPGSYAAALRGGLDDAQAEHPMPPLTALSVRSTGRIERVALDDVLWMAAAGNYVELHLLQRTLLHRLPLSQLEQRLDPQLFVRVHRSVIVRRTQCAALAVRGSGVYTLTLRCGAEVSVSERFVQVVRAVLEQDTSARPR